MKRTFWKLYSLIIVASVLLLSACSPASTPAPTAVQPQVQPTNEQPATSAPNNPQPTAASTVPPTAAPTKAAGFPDFECRTAVDLGAQFQPVFAGCAHAGFDNHLRADDDFQQGHSPTDAVVGDWGHLE